jgi:alpha-L-fucosidase
MDKEYSIALRKLVHSLQPDCLVSGRVGHDQGDYGSLGDNQIPAGPVKGDYETPATMNNTWGFRSDDENWKSPETLLSLLVDLAGKGINYLLNIGPDGLGRIPQPSVERLQYVGKWLKINGEAIYGTKASPFPYEFPWGRMTCKKNKLFLIFFSQPKDGFELPGLKNKVLKAYPLVGKGTEKLVVEQTNNRSLDCTSTSLTGFSKLDLSKELFPVVVLELEGEAEVDDMILQQPDGSTTLPAFMCQLDVGESKDMEISRSGFTDEWHDTSSSISWQCKILQKGTYELQVQSSAPRKKETRHERVVKIGKELPLVEIEILKGDESLLNMQGDLKEDIKVDSPRALHFPEKITLMGKCEISEPGIYRIILRAKRISGVGEEGLAVSGVKLVRV